MFNQGNYTMFGDNFCPFLGVKYVAKTFMYNFYKLHGD